MQDELAGAPVRILGINSIGSESGNEAMCDGRMLPWLQDTVVEHVWSQWDVTYRDIVILDEENRTIAVYNLTEHDLGNPANYAELKAMLESFAFP